MDRMNKKIHALHKEERGLRLSKNFVFRTASRSKPRFRANLEEKPRPADTFFFPCINSEIHAPGIYEFAKQIRLNACCRTKHKNRILLFRQAECTAELRCIFYQIILYRADYCTNRVVPRQVIAYFIMSLSWAALATRPDSASSAIRFGNTIRPLNRSDRFHTRSTCSAEPITMQITTIAA